MQKIGVIGGGSWATAIVKILQENCDIIYWWLRDKEQKKAIEKTGRNPKYLSSCKLEINKLYISTNLKEIINNSNIIIIATPSIYINDIFSDITLKDLENNINVANLLYAIVDFDTELARKAIDFFDNKITPKNYEIYNDLAKVSKDFLEDSELSLKYYEKYFINLKSLSNKYPLYLTLKNDFSDSNLFKNVKKDVEICLSFKDNSDYIISEKKIMMGIQQILYGN